MSSGGFGRCVAAALGLGLLAASGCAHAPTSDPARMGASFAPANHTSDATLGGIRRVVMLPVWVGEGTPPESAAALDPVFLAALQQEGRFEVVTISRAELRRRYGAEAIASTAALPHDLFAMLQREFAGEAVLFIDLTSYTAYQPLALGIRSKLAAIDGARLMWTFDHFFSSAPPAGTNSPRPAFLDSIRAVPSDLPRTGLHSPSKFAAHAAAAMFATLPPVTPGAVEIAK